MGTAFDADAAMPKKNAKNKAVNSKAVSDLEAENQQLRQELAAAKQRELDLITKGVAVAPAPAAPTSASAAVTGQGGEAVVASESAPLETVAKEDESQNKDLGEVVVKAKPKLAKLHDVPQSVSVVSGQELSRELALDLGSITQRASNVQFNQENTRGASLSIRGVGKRGFSETQDPSVGVTVDGVPYALTQLANFSFYDVDHVEVTRGPRGTEGGLSASAGKVNVVSKAPTFIPTAELSATYGEREAIILQGALGGPVIKDLLAWRGAFIVDKGRGFYEAEYNKNFSQFDRDRLSGRVQLLFTPTSTLTARLSADFEPRQPQLQNGLTFRHDQPFRFADGSLTDPNGTQARAKLVGFFSEKDDKFYNARSVFLNRSFNGRTYTYDDYIGGEKRGTTYENSLLGQTVHSQGAGAQINWEVADHVLTSITGVREYGFDAHNDEGTPFDISHDGGGGVDYSQWTQEVNLVNKPGGFIDYKVGAIGLWTKDNVDSKAGWGADAGAWFATNKQYNTLEREAGVNRGSGLALLKDSLQDATRFEQTQIRTQSGAAYAESKLNFTDAFSLTAGGRITNERRETRNFRKISNNGAGAALNPVSIRDVATGGFDSDADGELGANSADQLALANSVASRYFGKDSYEDLTAAQKLQVAAAKALRRNQLGRMNNTTGDKYDDLLFTGQLTPSYKINEDLTTYFAWQYGEKSGSVISVNGQPAQVKPEETHAFELGLKSFWLDKSVILNLDAFFMDIKNYQQTVKVVDEYQTQTNIANGQPNPFEYADAQGNVAKVQIHGVELDSVINTIPNLSIRLNGAYNVAEYVDYKNAAVPDELAYLPDPYIDQTGKTLSGASKWSFVVGAEYSRPVFDSQFIAHTSFNTSYQTEFNHSDTLSSYGWIGDRARTDASLGISSRDKIWDLSLIGKNIFNDTNHEVGWRDYDPNPYPRWFGIQVSGKI